MPTRQRSTAAQVISELQSDAGLRDQFVRALGDGIATKLDLAEQGRILERHTRALETLTEAVAEQGKHLATLTEAVTAQGKRIEEQGTRIEQQGKHLATLTEAVTAQGKRIEEQGTRIEQQGKHLATLTEAVTAQGKRIEEQGTRIEQQGKHLATLTEAVTAQGTRIEQQGKHLATLTEAVTAQGKRIEEAFRRVEALGARWGLHSEEAFREGMRSVLAQRFGARVRHWEGFDQEGGVFGHPASVELDLVVDNGGTLLIEVKSHVSSGDLAAFERKAKLYEQQTGTHAARMIVSPSVEPRALKMAEDLGIEVSTSLA
jgi:hypothetical protein